MQYYFISGIHPVIAALENKQREKKKILLSKENKTIEDLAYKIGVSCQHISAKKLHKIIQDDQINHQNVILEIGEKKFQTINKDGVYDQVFLCLNNINDMRNLGAIIRTAKAFSIENIILEKKINLSNNLIHRASSGMIEKVNIFYTVNLKYALEILKKQDYWITGLSNKGELNIEDFQWPQKNVIIFGSEGKGLKKIIEKNCDFKIKIPINAEVESLNLSNAVAIALASYRNKILRK
jgi:23S rRNA (guanosine2251-2'-O)-methyltransferase